MSAGKRQSSRAGQAGFIASRAARRKSRPGTWRNAPRPAPWRATCAASAPTATGSSIGGSISRKSMRFEVNWKWQLGENGEGRGIEHDGLAASFTIRKQQQSPLDVDVLPFQGKN